MISISVVVCTYNRADLLRTALESLCNQDIDRSLYEIIIVDNNSTDDTRSVVEGFTDHGNVQYIFEKKPGPSHARNAGWKQARGEYVGFFDDDAKAPENWLTVADRIIRDTSPDIFGGPYFPYYTSERPAWFKEEYESFRPWSEPRILAVTEHLCGTNIFFRRSLLEMSGGFDAMLGPHGDVMGYGEETALMITIRNRKPDAEVLYDPALYVFHLVRPDKMKIGWILHNLFIAGQYFNYVLLGRNTTLLQKGKALVRFFIFATLIPADCVYGLIFRKRARYPYFYNYFYEHTSFYVRGLGVSYERIAQRIRKRNSRRYRPAPDSR
jgi:glucosyl-dolichyl phosphate glucuronosyltransferase